ncbi:hypothetical protein [Desulfopila aestuarii]|nr:hypothetical protein [Desulfopila aestuarii]
MTSTLQAVYIYLGGNHKDQSSWREDFDKQLGVANISSTIPPLISINPFKRSINEKSADDIVARDMAILKDNRLKYVVLNSIDSFGSHSTGTASEMIIANYLKKPVITVINNSEENKAGWIHPFTQKFSSFIAHNLYDAVAWIVMDMKLNTEHRSLMEKISDFAAVYIPSIDDNYPFK